MMTERKAVVINPLGLHARPAAQFVKMAAGFAAHIEVEKDSGPVNAKSIMGVMMLSAEQGCTLLIRATGSDEERAVEALAALVAGGFGEL